MLALDRNGGLLKIINSSVFFEQMYVALLVGTSNSTNDSIVG